MSLRCAALVALSLLLSVPASSAQEGIRTAAAYNFWGAYEQEVGEWVVSLFSQGIAMYNSFGSVRYSSKAQAERCVDRLSKQAKSMDAIEVFRDMRVPADKLLFQWRWKLKIYSVVDEKRTDEGIRAKALAGDQQSAFIPIFLDCPDFVSDARFDATEDAQRDALRFIDITSTISALSFTTFAQCQSDTGLRTWATVPRYSNAGMYIPARSQPIYLMMHIDARVLPPTLRDSSTTQMETVFICHGMNALISTAYRTMNMDAPYSQPTVSNSGIDKEL